MPTLTTTATPANRERVCTLLAENVQRIVTLASDTDAVRSQWKPAPKEWSLREVIAHLRSSADINHFRIITMLATDTPTLPDVHPRNEWQRVVPYAQLDVAESLRAYQQQRRELLMMLGGLDEMGWKREGSWGGRRYSIYLVARSMALHEPAHLEQIMALVKGGSA